MIVYDKFDGELSEVERDPRVQELVMRQRKTMVELTARQAQDYVRLCLTVRKELHPETYPDLER